MAIARIEASVLRGERRADGTVAHADDAIRDLEHFTQAMRDIDHPDALLNERAQQLEQASSIALGQRSGWFVEQ